MRVTNPFRTNRALFHLSWSLALWGVLTSAVGCASGPPGPGGDDEEHRVIGATDETAPIDDGGGTCTGDSCGTGTCGECVPEPVAVEETVESDVFEFDAPNGASYDVHYTGDAAVVYYTSADGNTFTFVLTAEDPGAFDELVATLRADNSAGPEEQAVDWRLCALRAGVLAGDIAIAVLAVIELILIAKLIWCVGGAAIRAALAGLKNAFKNLAWLAGQLVQAIARNRPQDVAAAIALMKAEIAKIAAAVGVVVASCLLPDWAKRALKSAWDTFVSDWEAFLRDCKLE